MTVAIEPVSAAASAASSAASSISWAWKRFDALTGPEVYALLALRSAVFVVEQDCVFLDPDGLDRHAWHLLGHVADPGRPRVLAAGLRCLDPMVKYPEASIGRVVVAPAWRGTRLGRALMVEGIGRSRAAWPGQAIRIGAQQRLEAFYASLGFESEGEPYEEDGIMHREMCLPSSQSLDEDMR
jgi:ElaA protein